MRCSRSQCHAPRRVINPIGYVRQFPRRRGFWVRESLHRQKRLVRRGLSLLRTPINYLSALIVLVSSCISRWPIPESSCNKQLLVISSSNVRSSLPFVLWISQGARDRKPLVLILSNISTIPVLKSVFGGWLIQGKHVLLRNM